MACNKRRIYGFTWVWSRAVSCLQASVPSATSKFYVSSAETYPSVSFCEALMRINRNVYVCTFMHESLNAFLHQQNETDIRRRKKITSITLMCWSGLDYRYCVSFFPKRNFSAIFINVDRLILVMKVNVNTHNKMPQLLNG